MEKHYAKRCQNGCGRFVHKLSTAFFCSGLCERAYWNNIERYKRLQARNAKRRARKG